MYVCTILECNFHIYTLHVHCIFTCISVPLTCITKSHLFSCVDMMTELMDLLEKNPTVEFSTLVSDEEENFKVLCSVYMYIR